MGAADARTDAELVTLVSRIRVGDRLAEQQLVVRFSRPVRALVRRHCRPNEAHAEDIVQDVLSDVVQRLRSGLIEDPQALPHYLQVAIVNACRAHYRGNERYSTAADPDDTPDHALGADPAESKAREEQSKLLRALVQGLPVMRDREILRRFYFLEESRAEVCAAMNIDEAHFHRVVHRARERLREAWFAREAVATEAPPTPTIESRAK
jgi:RNA polymerase sigma-70 factor (ECF subfamily)